MTLNAIERPYPAPDARLVPSASCSWQPMAPATLPMRNEAGHGAEALEHPLEQDYPREPNGVLVTDGRTDDGAHNSVERGHFDPAILWAYTLRGRMRDLASQYLQYGWWKVETLRRHRGSLRWRQLLPPTFMVGMLAAALLAPWWTPAAVAVAAGAVAYLGVVGAVAWRLARPPTNAASVLAAFPIVHFSWSTGFVLNVLSGGRYPFRAQAPSVPRIAGAAPKPSVGGDS